ncbi:probable serine/threonine-protein kinase roco5 [Drosophila hydei]|uniref:Probable serine/threonine-protein kinase roco5 n=1 Tax=Drosophila hydei TaxID=7224 RepID=A0A6J1LBZ1_DROHY|nr:probable serine/threonine-protein kinase roco5 [Drosophila hydei]
MLQLLLALSCLLPMELGQAAFLMECEGVIINRIPNPNLECSEYVYCNGDDSYYCNDDCSEPVNCYGQEQEEQQEETTTTTTTTTKATTATELTTPSEEQPTASSSNSSTDSTTTSTTTSSTTAGNLQAICKSSGRNGVYPYPANDNYYYQCLAGYLLLQQCPQHFHFNEAQGQCISSKSYQL